MSTALPEAAVAPPRHSALSDLQRVRLVAEREFVEYARQPSFRNGTIVSSLVLIAVVAAASVLPLLFGGPAEVTLGVLSDGEPVIAALAVQVNGDSLDMTVTELSDRSAAEAAVIDGTVDAVVVDPSTVVVAEELSGNLRGWLQAAMDGARLAAALDTDPASALLAARVDMEVVALDPGDPAAAARRSLTLTGVLIAFGQVFGGAFVIASGMVEEKTSRVVEVIVAKARPRLLLTGKLLGLFGVITLQLIILFAVGLLAVAVSPDLSIPPGLLPSVGTILFWYTLSFVMFGSLFSIAGAMSARQEDMALKMQPMMLLAFAAFGAAFAATFSPDSVLSLITSFVPFTAPTVIPARLAASSVPAWQVILSVVITVAGAWAAVSIAGRAYTGGALRTRGTSTIRTVLDDADRT